jgi:hypothetical protein
MNDSEIITYINKCLQEGYSIDSIITTLKKAGYTNDVINDYLNKSDTMIYTPPNVDSITKTIFSKEKLKKLLIFENNKNNKVTWVIYSIISIMLIIILIYFIINLKPDRIETKNNYLNTTENVIHWQNKESLFDKENNEQIISQEEVEAGKNPLYNIGSEYVFCNITSFNMENEYDIKALTCFFNNLYQCEMAVIGILHSEKIEKMTIEGILDVDIGENISPPICKLTLKNSYCYMELKELKEIDLTLLNYNSKIEILNAMISYPNNQYQNLNILCK